MTDKNIFIGIDLGTTFSCVAGLNHGEAFVIDNQVGMRTTPSIVAFVPNASSSNADKMDVIVGEEASRQATMNPDSTIYCVKRLMGKKYSEIKNYKPLYKIVENTNGDAWVEIKNKKYSPSQISAYILSKLKDVAISHFNLDKGTKISAVITVPAYFNDAQRQATKDAAEIAGLTVARIINEPTAAALAYGLSTKKNGKIAVYDLGGGTFDISILEIAEGVFEVRSTSGDGFLGGADFDQKLSDYLRSEFQKQTGLDISNDKQALQRVREEAEKTKISLSSAQQKTVTLPFLMEGRHLEVTVTRAKFEELTYDLIERTRRPCEDAIREAGINVNELDEVILVGGMTRMPRVQEFVKDMFKKVPSKQVNPDEAVAKGAAIQASVLAGTSKSDIILLDVTPLSLGIETAGGVFTKMIERNTTIPTRKSQVFSTYEDNQTAVTIRVFQGERSMARDNKLLGEFNLEGIPPAQRGTPQIEVTFNIDANGIVQVSAKDKSTGKEQNVTIKDSGGLSKEDIDKMVREAEANAENDKKEMEKIDIKNKAESLLFTTKRSMSEHGDKLPEDLKTEINTHAAALDQAIKNQNYEEMNECHEKLSAVLQKINDAVQQAATQQPQGQQHDPQQDPQKTNENNSETVIDA